MGLCSAILGLCTAMYSYVVLCCDMYGSRVVELCNAM